VNRFSLTHLSNEVLSKELSRKAANEKIATAELLAHIAEFDERKLYLPAAYESMLKYCIGELGLSEDSAKKRIQVARVGRDCPAVFAALADGRVHLTGLRLLAPRLSPENAEELLAAATHKSMDEIEQLLAKRYPRPDVAARLDPVAPATADEGAPGYVPGPEVVANPMSEGAARHPGARVAPLSAEAYAVQFTQSREDHELFRYLQDLLGHQVPRGDIAKVYALAVRELVDRMERKRFGKCTDPRTGRRRSNPYARYIPNEVKRAVWQRDGGQCTYESESGRRCEARGDVEFDHVVECARGGQPTVENLRLRCRGHNQHTAEQTYGAGFMKQKREEAANARAAARAAKERAKAQKAAEREASRLQPHQLEVIPWLRELGCSEAHSRIAVERCRDMADAPLEDRVKQALRWFGARLSRTVSPVAPAAYP
jgi:5-methylcytosine-specific restriction endonuclease McrA